MGAKITNAGKEDWTYFDTFTPSAEHDLPANWTTLYIHVRDTRNNYADTILVLKGAFPSAAYYANNASSTTVLVNVNTNKITAINGTAKVYYK